VIKNFGLRQFICVCSGVFLIIEFRNAAPFLCRRHIWKVKHYAHKKMKNKNGKILFFASLDKSGSISQAAAELWLLPLSNVGRLAEDVTVGTDSLSAIRINDLRINE
jgi:hypothetical protein